MASAKLASMLLASKNPVRLRDFYAAAFDIKVDRTPGGEPGYDVLDFGGFYVLIDTRDDVSDRNPEPGRILLNFDVDDARATARRLTELGATWLAELEDRDGSLLATAIDPDGNYVQIIQLSEQHKAEMGGGT